jgi:hypothetical protein
MKWDLYRTDQFPDVARTWDEINAASRDLPILAARTIGCALQHFGRGDELIAIASEADRPVFGAVLRKRNAVVWDSFQPSQLPLGPAVNVRDLDLDATLASLAHTLPGVVASVGLSQIDPLLLKPPDRRAQHRLDDYIETAWIDVDMPFEDYWSQRGKNIRQNVRRQSTRLENDGTPARLTIIESPSSVADAVAAYGELEMSGWKGREGTAVHESNVQGRFYTALLTDFCGSGQGKIYQLHVGDRLVASDLCIEQAGFHVVLKTAHDEAEKRYSPSTLLRYHAFRSFFDRGAIRRIEFYGKRMEWHTRWTDNVRTLYHLTRFRSTAVRNLATLAGHLRTDAIDS